MTNPKEIIIREGLIAGDLGEIVRLHGLLYKKEFGYNVAFEAYVAEGLVEFVKSYDPAKDKAWIATHESRIVGFLLLMHIETAFAARLRFFLVRPEYRGLGLGKSLMDLFMSFLGNQGYQACFLTTTEEQRQAIALYKRYGFRLTKEWRSEVFGKSLLEQRYDLMPA